MREADACLRITAKSSQTAGLKVHRPPDIVRPLLSKFIFSVPGEIAKVTELYRQLGLREGLGAPSWVQTSFVACSSAPVSGVPYRVPSGNTTGLLRFAGQRLFSSHLPQEAGATC